jgi:hypothetical protein
MKRLLLLMFIHTASHQVFAVDKSGMKATSSTSFLDADYIITTTGGQLVVTDLTGAGETLEISENSGNIRFNVAGKTYRIDGGAITAFTTPADVELSGKTGVTIHAGAGDDVINVGAFSTQLPALTINGDAGNDVVNFNGNITFATDATLDLDLLNDGPAPGIDGLHLAAGAQLLLSGTGTAVVKMGRSITLATGSMLRSQNGNITLEANYQSVPNTERYIGVHIGGGTAEITGTGLLTIKGKGAANLGGVVINGGGQVIGGNTGIVHIEGKGTELATASVGGGISLEGTNSKITSHGADITIAGSSAGSDATNNPIGFFNFNGHVFAPGSANINITGYAKGTGVILFGGVVETAGGNITVNGQGGLTGIFLNYGSALKTIGAGNIHLSGTLVSNGVSSPYSGLAQDMSSSISTVDGHITLSGTGTETVDDISFYDAGGSSLYYSNITSVNGNIVIRADTFSGGTTNLITTNGYIAYLPRSTNRHIGLGSADIRGTGGILGLSDAELDFASAPTIKIGDSNTALVGGAAPISRAFPTNIEITGSGLSLTALLDVNGGDLLINTKGTVTGASGVDISAGTVSFGPENALVFAINGPVAETGYPQFNVVGTVDLTDVMLLFTRSYTPTSGEVYTLVVNDGTDAVIGTFKGLSEGTKMSNFLGFQLDGTISYTGGDGNDVVVSVTNPLPVTLVSFTGKKTADNQNLLKWFTTEEKDFDRFEIQRSEDARAFETIGSVDGATATSTALNSYEFADNRTKGDHYYRLKMVDTDGSFDYSKIISINSFGQGSDEQQIVGSFYPNPSSGQVYVDLHAIENDDWKITVLDANGRITHSENRTLQKGMNKIALDHLPSGLNLVRFENGGFNTVRKLVRK